MTLAKRVRDALAETAQLPVPFLGDGGGGAKSGPTPAAVLITLTDREAPGLILTQRPATMRNHPGQVAFPGGRIEPDDTDAIATALREAEEEIALPPGAVTIIDTLAPYTTITGFHITPVIGIVRPDVPLVPHNTEVDAIFEVPIAFLFDAANRVERRMMYGGTERRYFETMWGERRIWGATAAMIANLAVRLKW
jgi:8-oxo-dGTP pyrophosphatase MutT (NUDIX family)